MSAIQVATAAPDIADRRIPWGRLRDTSAVIKRNLLQYLRVPQLLVFSTIQPIIFVLMFRFVFGGSIDTGRIPYVDFLMPGIFLQVVVFGSLATAIGSGDRSEERADGTVPRVADVDAGGPGRTDGRGPDPERLRRVPHDGRRVPGRVADPHHGARRCCPGSR